MSEKNLTPDNANSPDNDGIDVPTYSSQQETTMFDRAGRVPPQEIPAAEPSYRDQDFAPTPAPSYETVSFDREPVASAPAAFTSDPFVATEVEETAAPDYRRGTTDFGLLIVRLLLGVWLILEAVGTFFRLGGNAGISGLEAEFAGYLVPSALAIIIPSLQLAAGVFLVLGLITPFFAMIATIASSFTALHALTGTGAGLNVFAWSEAVWLSVVLLGISVALQFTGPGLYSFDYGRSWARRPLVSSWVFVLLAIAGGVALWWFGAGTNPLN
ncbi:DoxX family protein [Corynebacterium testudinoris]|uniref:DoxX family protein n=1 Tax=Corynebacterium testudinoris TaxID=136857 RepID=UPI001C8BA810|nr:DoxX family protein [Corynebacterium testudinoris]MBX8994777.1 DoxX family protein [Corynebacterium testudinoris]